MAGTTHTIVLVQVTPNRATRTFTDHETVHDALDDIIASFEVRLKENHPRLQNFTYSLSDLLAYIDSLTDISALVYDAKVRGYIPHDKEWIKLKISSLIQRQQK